MSKEITIDKLTIGNKLTSREVDSTDIFVDGVSIKETLKKLPPTWVKSVNNTLPDENGNIELDISHKECTAFEIYPTNTDIEAGTKSDIECEWTPWISTTNYKIGDLVTDDVKNNLYVAIAVSKNIQPEVNDNWSNYWKKIQTYGHTYTVSAFYTITEGNNDGCYVWNNNILYRCINAVPAGTDWNATTTYKANQSTRANNAIFIAKKDNKNVKPGTTSGWEEYWSQYIIPEPGVTEDWQNYWKVVDYTSPIKDGYLTYQYHAPASGMKITIDGYLRGLDSEKDETIVDWGDGSPKQTYRECQNSSGKAEHTYTESKKYIVKIYGPITAFKAKGSNGYNPISRIWDIDLPMASTMWNCADLCAKDYVLLKVKVPDYNYKFVAAMKIYGAFHTCVNLQIFKFGKVMPQFVQGGKLFIACRSLKTIDWDPENFGRFPNFIDGDYEYMYQDCNQLTTKLSKLLPINIGWNQDRILFYSAFLNDELIPVMDSSTETAVGKILWTATKYEFIMSSQGSTFKGCSDALRAQVPTTWGGTKL